ncbi:type I restriction-modification system subunit M [Oceanivirga salmonicida]|uniref:type I restriction-modification system subunit M n=1 Tax=Oceanivirga salmonicida TaxID=1769291 RepID=UPI00082DE029|nr:type I restriction-modification system subunit M [Oceanivirga salmonicida]
MLNKKETERAELHKTIWNIANDLRGSVDGWDFKQYVLGFLFYRYISENMSVYINNIERNAGDLNFSYENETDEAADRDFKDWLIDNKGFYIKPSQLFCNVSKNAMQDKDLNITLKNIFDDIEKSTQGQNSSEDFKGLFDDILLNSPKLGETVEKRNEKLAKILVSIGELKLGDVKDNTIDAFGDAYEYLMAMYASNAGKSGGEYYTPQEVSELLARLTVIGKTKVNKVYDPAVGSGSLLLKFAKILGKDNVKQGFFGQELNMTTYNLCRINMFLHDIDFEKFNIKNGDTLTNPKHDGFEPFEAIVSNPPYSIKWAGKDDINLVNDERYSVAGVLAPKSKADLAFIMHSLSYLASNGTAAIVCFPGVMYRGGAEQKIRKYLVENNFVDGIIQLPSNLFFGTSIATCILVLKKGKKDNKTIFIDASNECIKVTNSNKLKDENIQSILETYINRQDKEYVAKLVDIEEIRKENFNLSVNTFVEQEDTREKIDIKAVHKELREIEEKQNILRAKIREIIKDLGDDYEIK